MAWRTRGHRGDTLEEILMITNDYYRKYGYARIDKFPVPITVTQMNESGQITLAYFEKQSTVDFVGAAQGNPICFDAKETSLKSFPLSNIHQHQLEYLQDFRTQGGISFLIIHFKAFQAYYLVPLELVEKYVRNCTKGGRKSIPYTAMLPDYRITVTKGNLLNYLPVVELYRQEQKSLAQKWS